MLRVRITPGKGNRDLQRKLKRLPKEVAQKALARTVNRAVDEARLQEVGQMHRDLDRPTNFTASTNAFFLRRARLNRGTRIGASATIKDRQASYLRWQIEGGVQRPKGGSRYIPVPDERLKTNKHGNVPAARKRLGRLAGQQTTRFSRKAGGGVWRPRGRGVKGNLYNFVRAVRYRPIYDFGMGAERWGRRNLARVLREEITKAARRA